MAHLCQGWYHTLPIKITFHIINMSTDHRVSLGTWRPRVQSTCVSNSNNFINKAIFHSVLQRKTHAHTYTHTPVSFTTWSEIREGYLCFYQIIHRNRYQITKFKTKWRDWGMACWLGALAKITEDPSSIPSIKLGGSQPPGTPASRDPKPSSRLRAYVYRSTRTQKYTNTQGRGRHPY